MKQIVPLSVPEALPSRDKAEPLRDPGTQTPMASPFGQVQELSMLTIRTLWGSACECLLCFSEQVFRFPLNWSQCLHRRSGSSCVNGPLLASVPTVLEAPSCCMPSLPRAWAPQGSSAPPAAGSTGHPGSLVSGPFLPSTPFSCLLLFLLSQG